MAMPRPPLVENWEEFLENNYYLLSRRVRVENLLDHLRSKTVLSQDDVETVLHFATQFMKAGKLVDIIKTRGRPGFEAYMEAIEFEYPDLYLEMTSIQPRQRPDTGKRRSHSRQSELVFAQMGQLVGTFTEELIVRKSEVRKFQELVDSLKAELAEERKITEERFRQFEEEKDLLVQEKEQLSKRLADEQLAKEELEKFEKSRADKLNDLYDLSRKPAVLSSMGLNPAVFSQAGKPGATDNENKGKVQLTKNKLHSYPSHDSGVGSRPGDGTRDRKDQVPLPGPEGTDADLQQTNVRLQHLVEEFKKEAEQYCKRLAEAEKVSRELANEKENMKNEARQLEEKCELMADMVRALKNETDNGRRIQKKEKKEQIGTFQFPQMFSVNEAGDEKKRKDTSTQIEGPRLPRSPQGRPGAMDVSELFRYSFNILGGSTDRPDD